MTIYCHHCKKTVFRDMRLKVSKMVMTKRGYKSYCEDTGRAVCLNVKK